MFYFSDYTFVKTEQQARLRRTELERLARQSRSRPESSRPVRRWWRRRRPEPRPVEASGWWTARPRRPVDG
jgi:hypothetical protein